MYQGDQASSDRVATVKFGVSMQQRTRRRIEGCALMLMTAVLLIAGGEGVYRLLGYWKNGTFDGLREYDPELAWRSVRNYRGKDVQMQDKLGRPYARTLTTDSHGSRLWGTRPGAPRLLFLGDSFTEAIEVSDDKTYGAVFSRLSGFDVYVLGTGAYVSMSSLFEGKTGCLDRIR